MKWLITLSALIKLIGDLLRGWRRARHEKRNRDIADDPYAELARRGLLIRPDGDAESVSHAAPSPDDAENDRDAGKD